MLLSDICRRAAIGGTLDSVAGSRVTSAFISLSSSSSWLRTAIKHLYNTIRKVLKGVYSVFIFSGVFFLTDPVSFTMQFFRIPDVDLDA